MPKNTKKAIEEIQFIKKIISDSKKLYFDDGIVHIIWAIAVITGIIITYILIHFKITNIIHYFWIALYLISLTITIIYKNKILKNKAINFAGKIYNSIWQACGISIVLSGIFGIALQRIEINIGLAIISSFLAIAYFISARIGVYQWMHYIAAGWWLCSIIVLFLEKKYAPVIVTIFTIFLVLIPGIYLLKKQRTE